MADPALITGARPRAPASPVYLTHPDTMAIGATLILSRVDRQRIEAHIGSLIAMLDPIDSACKQEDDDDDRCEAGDGGCGPFVLWHYGTLWGANA